MFKWQILGYKYFRISFSSARGRVLSPASPVLARAEGPPAALAPPPSHPGTGDPEPLLQTHTGPRKTVQGGGKHTPASFALLGVQETGSTLHNYQAP